MTARADRAARREAEKQAWIAEQVAKFPPFSEAQKQLIRSAFATLRTPRVDAA